LINGVSITSTHICDSMFVIKYCWRICLCVSLILVEHSKIIFRVNSHTVCHMVLGQLSKHWTRSGRRYDLSSKSVITSSALHAYLKYFLNSLQSWYFDLLSSHQSRSNKTTGCWLLATTDCWLLATTGCWLLATTGCWRLTTWNKLTAGLRLNMFVSWISPSFCHSSRRWIDICYC